MKVLLFSNEGCGSCKKWRPLFEQLMKEYELDYEVTEGQKEYMESHMAEVDEKLENRFDEAPHSIRFEPFFNGVEDVYTCECYF